MIRSRLGKVSAKNLQVDRRVQREVRGSQIKYLQKNWNDLASGVLIVSQRDDGMFFVIDGQHRALSKVQLEPNYKFDARIFSGLTLEDEAMLFNLYNDKRKGVKAHERYKIYLVSGDEPYVSVEKILHNHRLQITSAPGDNGVAAVQKVLAIYNKFGGDVLEGTLSVVEASWGRQRDTWHGQLLGCAAIMLASGAPSQELVKTLRSKVPSAWLSVHTTRAGSGSEQRDLELSRVVLELYNKGKARDQKIAKLTNKRTPV